MDMSLRRLRVGAGVIVVWGSVAGGLCPLEAELAGDLVAQGTVFGSKPGDFSAGGVEPLAERVGAGPLRGNRGRGCVLLAKLADEVGDLAVAVEPASGDAG